MHVHTTILRPKLLEIRCLSVGVYNSFSKYFLKIYLFSGNVLVAGKTAGNTADMVLVQKEL